MTLKKFLKNEETVKGFHRLPDESHQELVDWVNV